MLGAFCKKKIHFCLVPPVGTKINYINGHGDCAPWRTADNWIHGYGIHRYRGRTGHTPIYEKYLVQGDTEVKSSTTKKLIILGDLPAPLANTALFVDQPLYHSSSSAFSNHNIFFCTLQLIIIALLCVLLLELLTIDGSKQPIHEAGRKILCIIQLASPHMIGKECTSHWRFPK